MIVGAVEAAGEIEGDVLVAAAVVDALSVLVLQLESLTAKVHLAESFTRADETFVGLALEADGGALGGERLSVAAADETDGKGVVAGWGEMVVAEGDRFPLVAIGIEGDVGEGLWSWQQIAPGVETWCAEVYGASFCPLVVDDVGTVEVEGCLVHSHLKHLVAVGHLVAGHGDEQAEDVGAVGAYHEGVGLLRDFCVRSHVGLMLLPLKSDVDEDVAIALSHA